MEEDSTLTAHSPALAATAPGAGGDVAPGARLGRYEIVCAVGEGGMGVVYRARDPQLDRDVALKLLRVGAHGGSGSDPARLRLLREAQAMARLSHPNVISVYEVDTVGDRDFVAMEFVDGGTLGQWCESEPRPWRDVLRAFVDAGRGLEAAHRAGLVHRDFKPANVLVRRDGRVLVTDFGLARMEVDARRSATPAQPGSPDAELTHTGSLLGTPAYMSPEQHRGDPADERSDQFSFCVALYEALYRRRPFAGDDLAALRAAITAGEVAEPADEGAAPAALWPILRRGLAVDPAARYASMGELLGDLEGVLAPPRRGRLLALAGAVLPAAIVAAVALTAVSRDEPAASAGACGDTDQLFDEAWNADDRGAVEAAFAAIGRGGAAEQTIAGLDRYRSRWTGAYQQVCDAGDDVDEAERHRRIACLLSLRRGAGAVVAQLRDAGATLAGYAPQLVGDLGDPALCGVGGAAGPVLPEDAEERAAAMAIREQLSRQAARVWSSDRDRALDELRELVAEARALGHPPLLAEALYERGRALSRIEHNEAARELLEEAVLAAEEGDHQAIRARALVDLARIAMWTSSDPERVDHAFRRAEVAVGRYGDPALDDSLSLVRARIALRREQMADAYALASEVKLRAQDAGHVWRHVEALDVMAEVRRLERAFDAAVAYQRKRLAVVVRASGEDSLNAARALEQLAAALGHAGAFDEARRAQEAAAAIWATERGQEELARFPFLHAGPRTLRGVVVDAGGEPVAGAQVVVAVDGVIGDENRVYLGWGPITRRSRGIWLATTGDDGGFRIDGLPGRRLHVAAEHEHRGRSGYHELAADASDSVNLALLGRGAVSGRVVAGDPMPPGYHLHLAPVGHDGFLSTRLEVQLREDNRFRIERAAAGRYFLQVVKSERLLVENLATVPVTVRPGDEARVDIEVDLAGADVAVTVRGERDFDIALAAVALLQGHLDDPPDDGAAFVNAYVEVVRSGVGRVEFTTPVDGEQVVVFEGVDAGDYTMCAFPINQDPRAPGVFEKLWERRGELDGRCDHVTVSADGAGESLVIEVPPMKRLD